MKIIIIFFIISFLSINLAFAETNIVLQSVKNDIEAWEWFPVQIVISSDDQTSINIESIWGLADFETLWRTQSNQIQTINWMTSSQVIIEFVLRSNTVWKFILWPVKIKSWEESIVSNTIDIIILKSEVDNIVNQQQVKQSEQENTTIDEKQKTISNMQDIHDVKDIEISLNMFKFKGIYQLLSGALLLYIFYVIYNKILLLYNIRKNTLLDEKNRLKNIVEEKGNIYTAILDLSENMKEIWKDDFYADLNYLFRRYFVYLWHYNAYKMTLKELQEMKIDTKIFDIFSMSYMYEFSLEEDSMSKRKQILMNFMIYLKK